MQRYQLKSESIFESTLPIAKFKEINNCTVTLRVKVLKEDGKILKKGDKTAYAVLTLEDGTAESIGVSRNLIADIENKTINAESLMVGVQDGREVVYSNVSTGVSV